MDEEELGLGTVSSGCPVETDLIPLGVPAVGAVVASGERKELFVAQDALDFDFSREPPAYRARIVFRLDRNLDGTKIPELGIRRTVPVVRLLILGVELALVAFQLSLFHGYPSGDHLRNGLVELGVRTLSVDPTPLVELAVRISPSRIGCRLEAAVDRSPDDTVLLDTFSVAYSVLDIGVGIEGVADGGVVGLDFVTVSVSDKQ